MAPAALPALAVTGGAATLSFTLPRQGVTLLVID
jgi:xylan 1,4-beta-xylosidase